MFKHLTFEGVEKKDNKECNIQEKAIIMKEKEKITLQKSINNKVLYIVISVSYTHLDVYKRQVQLNYRDVKYN